MINFLGNSDYIKRHNYYKKIARLISENKIDVNKVGVTDLEIRHDNDCGIFSRKNCNCDPDILLNGKKLK